VAVLCENLSGFSNMEIEISNILIWRIGVEVGATEWCLDGFSEKKKVVSRDSIEQAVRRLMDGGDEVEEIRRLAQEFGKKATQAVEDGGSSYNNLLALIDNLKRLSKPLD